MKVLRLAKSSDSAKLVEATLAEPEPGPGQVLVRVSATAITPTEPGWFVTSHDASGAPREGAILSHEFSGTVAALGSSVHDFTVGQAVFGMNDWFADGALAEYCLTGHTFLAPAPLRLAPTQAATVPISALTAWQGLFQHGHLHPGDRVLVHGGAGAVGLFAIQIAHLHGAHVIATASPEDFPLLRGLGAKELIDYHSQRFEEVIQGPVDIVFDTVGGDTLLRSFAMVKHDRFVVTIATTSESSGDPRVKNSFFIVKPNPRQLMEIATLIDTGKLRTFVDAVVPFADAADAFNGKVTGGTGHGKVVVTVNPPTL